MRIILDENLRRPLKRIFPGHTVTTVQEQGLSGTPNGALVARLEGVFDVFVTADKNLRYRQNLSGRSLAIFGVAFQSAAGSSSHLSSHHCCD